MLGYKMYASPKLIVCIVSLLGFLAGELPAQLVIEKGGGDAVMLWLEAEAGTITPPMMVFDRVDASGGQFMEVKSGNNNTKNAPVDGHAIYKFNLQSSGIYKVWGLVKIDMADEDAFWVKMDNDPWAKWKGIEVGCKWHWDEVHDNLHNNQVLEYKLEAGPHTLVFTYCMDQSRLDKLLITNDLDFIPAEKGPGAEALFKLKSPRQIVNQAFHFNGSASSSTEGAIVKYDWDFGDGKSASGMEVDHIYDNEGEYQVKLIVTDDAGLYSRVTKTVMVCRDEPFAIFDHSPNRSRANEVVSFDASESFDPDGIIVNYSWDFGDGTSGEGVVEKHRYISNGEYSATLTVTNDEGDTENETRLVTVITGIPKKIIYETDMCLDVDDVGALAMLHGLVNNSEADLLAVCYNEVHPSGVAAIDAINTWYGRGEIPIGIYIKELADPDKSDYLDALKKFPHDLERETSPCAVDVYRKVLSEQADNSVTIVSVGFLNNLYDLLIAEPELVKQKVKELVVMGSINGGGFNLDRHTLKPVSEYVIRNWPSSLVFSQPGTCILTGSRLENSPEKNPVREAYFQFFNSNFCVRPSWDQVAVLYGVRGVSDYFSVPANVERWQLETGQRSWFEEILPDNSYARIIEDLMLEPPKN